jgi:hypothetical protein
MRLNSGSPDSPVAPRRPAHRHMAWRAPLAAAAAVAGLLLEPSSLGAQVISHRGFIQGRAVGHPETTPSDERHVLVDGLARYEPTLRLAAWLRVLGGIDASLDSWEQTDQRGRLDLRDRGIQRPSLSLRRLTASLTGGGLTLDLGKQFIRWGRTDILAPTDRFAPRDYLEVRNEDFLGVSGVRVMYEASGNTVDFIWVPLFTPSRLPLLRSRWAPVPDSPNLPPLDWASTSFPEGSQFGARWSVVGSRGEFSLSGYEGFNHLPIVQPQSGLDVQPQSGLDPSRVELLRIYPQMRMYGVDAAVPLPWLTVKGEGGYFKSEDLRAEEYVLYVIELERQIGEWSLVGGYSGEKILTPRPFPAFAPDRGLARAWLGRASYTIGANRSVAFEGAQRANGDGTWVSLEYSETSESNLRTTISATFIAGKDNDFLGQYHRNSHVTYSLRYSF